MVRENLTCLEKFQELNENKIEQHKYDNIYRIITGWEIYKIEIVKVELQN